MREILNAIFYSVRSGCAWRLLPHDFPPWKTIYHYFRTWRIDGTSERMHNALRQRVRIGRDPQPVLKSWAKQWSREGVKLDWEKLMPPNGFQVLPKRWVVERTFSWTDQKRRISKDYERQTETSEAFIYVAISRLMARRLACS
jgi:transposase